jgi:hypothetical protein
LVKIPSAIVASNVPSTAKTSLLEFVVSMRGAAPSLEFNRQDRQQAARTMF